MYLSAFMSFGQAGALEASGDTTGHDSLTSRYLLPAVPEIIDIRGAGFHYRVTGMTVIFITGGILR